jgi:hypothetical protein
MMNTNNLTTPPITAKLIKAEQRLNMLPNLMIKAEAMIYFRLSQLSADYQGGYWECYQLSNGGFYLAPSDPERLRLYVSENDFLG